jgi:hypothetical protein
MDSETAYEIASADVVLPLSESEAEAIADAIERVIQIDTIDPTVETELHRLMAMIRIRLPLRDEPQLPADRPHRHAVGQGVVHVDQIAVDMMYDGSRPAAAAAEADGGMVYEVLAQTWRVRDGVRYPTYTLLDEEGETAEDVLCTVDLIAIDS